MTDLDVRATAGDDYLRLHLRTLPAFRSLVRAVECRLFAEAGPLGDRVLDVGCGDGHFAASAFRSAIFAGIDPSLPAVREAARRGKHVYANVAGASAAGLPFKDGAFDGVIANSVLEHVSDIETALDEVRRVLKPDGRFVFSVPGHRFPEMLLGSTILRAARLKRSAARYGAWFNAHSGHFHVHGPDWWIEKLARRRFAVERREDYISAEALRVFDLLHYLGVPALAFRKLTGRWILWRNPLTLFAADKLLRPHYESGPQREGAYLFFAARRQA